MDFQKSLLENQNDINIGRKFSSYKDLIEFLQYYESENKQKFYKKRSRTIKSARKYLQRELKESLEFYEIEFECIHGKERSKRGNGLRRTSTLRLGCESYFKLRVDSTGEYLIIQSANLNHTNHDLSKNVFEHLYQNRGLNENELEDVEVYLSLDANKKKIQNKILLETGKKTTLKDLHNIHYKMKIGKNDLQEAVNMLKTKYRCHVQVLCDEENNFKALQFTTENMRNAMSAWPEFVSVDGTYKLIDIGCTVFLCLVEDSNGQSEIVCVSLLSVEDKDAYYWVFNTFKDEMDTEKIMCFMGDKDLVERDVIKELFPDIPVYLCLFHTLKTFKREISCDKLNVSKDERDLSLEYLQKMVYSKNHTEYDILYTQFKECVPQSVSSYFDKNWHKIRSDWLVCNMKLGNLNNTTNNRMESINSKIKQVIPKNSSLIEFIKNFFIFLDSNNQERDINAANHILKKSLQQFKNHGKDLRLYSDFLTNYSFNFVQQQINSMDKVKVISELGNGVFEVGNLNDKISVTADTCQCTDFSSIMLPCRHILAVRERSQIPLFLKSLCHVRWTKEYYLLKQRICVVNSNTVAEPKYSLKEKRKIKTLTEKRKAATLVTNSLVNLLSLASYSEFNYKLELLKKLEHSWRIGKDVTVEIIDADQTYTTGTINFAADKSPDKLLNTNHDNEVQILYYDSHVKDVDIVLKPYTDTIFDNDLNNTLMTSTITETISTGNDLDKTSVTSATELVGNNNTDFSFQAVNSDTIEPNNVDEICVNSNSSHNIDINSIVLPPKIKTRGRPKGHDITVVGLKKKRNKNIPVKYTLKSKIQQIFDIISIILNDNTLLSYKSIEDQTFQINNANDIKDELPDVILDSCVVLEDLKEYFTHHVWEFFLRKVNDKKLKNDWSCKLCLQPLGNEPSIVCESCLFWYHLKCSGLTKVPRVKTWFCRLCSRSKKNA